MIKIGLSVVGMLAAVVTMVLVLGGIPKSKGGAGSQSKIETAGLQHGIEIVGPNDAAFAGLMSKQLQKNSHLNVDGLKSTSVFVVNKSAQAIAALSVNWVLLQPDGSSISHATAHKSGLVIVSEGDSPHLMEIIASNGHRLFSLLDLPDGSNRASGHRMGGGGGVDKARQLFESVKVTVSVDGVLFVDGAFVGPDTKDFFGLLKAEIDARRDLIEELGRALNGDAEAMKRVELLADGRPVGTRAASDNHSFYDVITQTQASVILARRKKFGDRAVLESINAELSKPRINLRKLRSN